jgi:hypothetical protein
MTAKNMLSRENGVEGGLRQLLLENLTKIRQTPNLNVVTVHILKMEYID